MNDFNKIVEIFVAIATDSSRTGKEMILRKNADNEFLMEILEYTYNPYKVYGIGAKGFGKKYQTGGQSVFEDVICMLQFLLQNPTGSDYIKKQINTWIATQPEHHQEWLKRIILKDLKIGATESTFNKVWKDLIPTFDVMLAHPFERLPKRISCEYKFDGVRATAVKINGQTNLFTRNGKTISGFNDVIEQINSLPLDNYVFDGELISNNNFKETMEKVFKKDGDKVADFMMFDLLPISEFNNGVSTENYEQRRIKLVQLLNDPNYAGLQNIKLAKVIRFLNNPTVKQISELTKQAVDEGLEGIMVKDMDSLYKCKRDYGWQKCKIFLSDEFTIIGFEEGEGRLKGSLGKVIIDVDGVQVGVGSGFDEDERKDIWKNQEKYLGMQIEVQYQEKIEKTGSLRFPTIKGIRYDKEKE